MTSHFPGWIPAVELTSLSSSESYFYPPKIIQTVFQSRTPNPEPQTLQDFSFAQIRVAFGTDAADLWDERHN
jgi:hypothetical protein